MKMRRIVLAGGLLSLLAFLPLSAQDTSESALEEASTDATSSLGVRQQRIGRMMSDLERKLTRLADSLQENEPGRAEKLRRTLEESRDLLMQERMRGIVGMLDDTQLDDATAEQRAIILQLRELVDILLEEDSAWDEVQREIEQLEAWKKRVEDLIDQELEELAESDRLVNREDTLSDLDAQIAGVRELIERQENVVDKIEQAREEGIQAFRNAADEQEEVREETEQLAEEAEGQSSGQPSEGQPSEGQPSEGQPSEGQPSEGQPSEGQPSEGQPSEGQPSEGQPSEGQPSEGQPSEGQPSEGQPSEGQPSPSPSQPGQESLEKAIENQEQAEEELQEGEGRSAQSSAERAVEDLEDALEELESERSRIASLPPEALEQMAEDQDRIAEEAERLASEMQEASQGSPGQPGEGQPGEGQLGEGKPSPAQQAMQEAQEAMQQASNGLREEDPEAAADDQEQAARDLEEARRAIEERLAQLREESILEQLARLEERFANMYAVQQAVTSATLELESRRGEEGFNRPDRLAVAGLAEEERRLAVEAQQALDIIIGDGTSVVFPSVVEGLRDDLRIIGDLLDSQHADAYTQLLQEQVEATLQDLIEALQRAQKAAENKPSEPSESEEQEQPLMPDSAELKLLQASQVRVMQRTIRFYETYGEGPYDESTGAEVNILEDRQENVAVLAQEIIDSGIRSGTEGPQGQ